MSPFVYSQGRVGKNHGPSHKLCIAERLAQPIIRVKWTRRCAHKHTIPPPPVQISYHFPVIAASPKN